MTTYQDPPLQSRRAVRQGERPEAPQPSSPFAPPQVPRTAAGAGEPLSYVTQNRPPLPGYETSTPSADAPQAHRGRRAAEPADASPSADAHPSFRPRDFSPEARTAPPAWSPEHDRESGIVEYHTQARASVAPPPPTSLAASLAGAPPEEQTLSRRELRALREEAGITAQETGPVVPLAAAPQPVAPAPQPAAPAPQLIEPPVVSAPPAPVPSTQLDSAMAEFDALAGRTTEEGLSRRAARRAAPEPAPQPAPQQYVSESVPVPSQPYVSESVAVPAPQQDVSESVPVPAQPAPQQYGSESVPVPAQPAPQPQAFAAPPEPAPMAPAQFAPPVAPAAVEPVAPTTGERPVGHWTNQSDLDDRTQINPSTISRTIGSGAITTSALVLPSIPGHDMTTGEVMLTGSVSLPASLAATGAHHSIDESDLDHLLDPGDHQAVNTDSVPIRAIRAVSSHTNSRNQVLAAAKPHRGNRALTALIVSASGMVVVVVTLLVVALVNGGL
jgi:hypothetical protein